MPVSGNYGTPTNPYGDLYSSYWEYTGYTSDPPHTEGDMWLRTDLNSGDKIATLRFDHGSGVWDIPVFATSETPDSKIKKVWRIQTPNGEGFIPLYEQGGAFNQLGFQHAGVRHGVHDSLFTIPDSGGTHQWNWDEGSGTTLADAIGSLDGTVDGATWQTDAGAGGAYLSFDGSNDRVTLPASAASEFNHWTANGQGTFFIWVNRDTDGDFHFIWGGVNASSDITVLLRINDGNGIDARAFDGGGNFIYNLSAGSVTSSDGWTPVAVTADGSTARLYVGDSSNTLSQVDSDSIANTTSGDLTDPPQFGLQPGGALPFAGGMDLPWTDSVARSQSDLQTFVDNSEAFYT